MRDKRDGQIQEQQKPGAGKAAQTNSGGDRGRLARENLPRALSFKGPETSFGQQT